MNGRTVSRRRLLTTTGAVLAAGLAGCLNGDNSNGGTEDGGNGGGGDGFAPTSVTETDQNTSTEANTSTAAKPSKQVLDSYQTKLESGVSVPLASIDDVYPWYLNKTVRMVDARSAYAYDRSHVAGAVLSPANGGQSKNDPTESWPKDAWIVTYCGCPHHLSSIRAAELSKKGFSNVMALDEGFGAWQDRNYPLEGSKVNNQPQIRTIVGQAATKFAGETAWAFHHDTGQKEATDIIDDGSYTLNLPFYDVTDESLIEIETPGYTIEKPLGELTSATVTTSGALRVASE